MEFLRYPQVIPGLFNGRGFGPPRCLTTASACSWIGHPVSGLIHATSFALFRLGLPAPPVLQYLKLATYINSPDRSTKSTRSHINVLSVLVSTRFQVLFHSPPGVLFTFPSRYCSTIGHWVVFRLRGWSPLIPTGFHVSCGTLDPASALQISPTGLSPCIVTLPSVFGYHLSCISPSIPRKYCYLRFGLFRVRSPLLTESRLISFPRPT